MTNEHDGFAECREAAAKLVKTYYANSKDESHRILKECGERFAKAILALKPASRSAEPSAKDIECGRQRAIEMGLLDEPSAQGERFERWWATMEAKGYRYGTDAMENVRLGFEGATRSTDSSAEAKLDWCEFDDGATADAIRKLGIRNPTLKEVTQLQKDMAEAAKLTTAPHAADQARNN